MGNDSTKINENIYFKCRKEAALYDERLRSRESAADLLGVSPSSLADYELGNTKVVPVDKESILILLVSSAVLRGKKVQRRSTVFYARVQTERQFRQEHALRQQLRRRYSFLPQKTIPFQELPATVRQFALCRWLGSCIIRYRQIVGNYIRFTLLFPNVLQSDYSITAIRIIDVNNKEIARRDLSVDVNSIQTVLFVLSISYQEV